MGNGFASSGFTAGPMAPAEEYERTGQYSTGTRGPGSSQSSKGFTAGPMAPATEYTRTGRYPMPPPSRRTGGNIPQPDMQKLKDDAFFKRTGMTREQSYDRFFGRNTPSVIPTSTPSGFSVGPMAPAAGYTRTGRYPTYSSDNVVYLPKGMSAEQYYSVDTSNIKRTGIVDTGTGAVSMLQSGTAKKLIGSNIESNEALNKITENKARFKTPFYTLITSRVSATPEVIERAGKQADKVTGFVTRVGVTGLVTGSAIAATGPLASGALSGLGVGGTALSAAKFGTGVGLSILSPKIAEETYKTSFMFTNPTEYKLIRDPLFQQAVDYGKGQYYGSISNPSVDNTFKTIGGWVPGVRQILQGGGLKSGVTEFYLKQGYSGSQAKRLGELAFETNIAQGFGDVAGTIGLETSSEVFGRKASSRIFKWLENTGFRTKTRVTLSAAGALVPAGFLEGSSEYVKERIMENQPVKLYETTSLGPVPIPSGVLGAGAFGSVFATGLGTTIARRSVGRPGRIQAKLDAGILDTPMTKWERLKFDFKTQDKLLLAARIIDPYEYPGDVVGGALVSGKLKFRTKVSNFIPTGIASNPNFQVEQIIKSGGKGSSVPIINYSNIFNPSATPSTSSIPNYTPVSITSTSPVPTPTPTSVTINIPTFSEIIDTTPIEYPTDVPTTAPTTSPVSMSTQAPTNIMATVPIASPLFRLPFIHLHGGGGRGSKGFSGMRLRKGYSFKEFKVPDLDKLIGKNMLGKGYTPPSLKKLLGGFKL